MRAEKKLEELGILLPTPPNPVATYTACKQTGNLVFVSGQGPIIEGKQLYTGKLGGEVSKEQGYEAAKACGINLLAQLKKYLGDLDKVKEVVHVKGFVACRDDFFEHPAVINGVSDLMVAAFGDAGLHTRCALGTNALPGNIPVEAEMIVEVYSA